MFHIGLSQPISNKSQLLPTSYNSHSNNVLTTWYPIHTEQHAFIHKTVLRIAKMKSNRSLSHRCNWHWHEINNQKAIYSLFFFSEPENGYPGEREENPPPPLRPHRRSLEQEPDPEIGRRLNNPRQVRGPNPSYNIDNHFSFDDVIAWVGFSDLPGVIQSPFYLWFGTHSRPLYWGCRGVQKCASRGGHLGLEKKRWWENLWFYHHANVSYIDLIMIDYLEYM